MTNEFDQVIEAASNFLPPSPYQADMIKEVVNEHPEIADLLVEIFQKFVQMAEILNTPASEPEVQEKPAPEKRVLAALGKAPGATIIYFDEARERISKLSRASNSDL
jgi:hypothetical protein